MSAERSWADGLLPDPCLDAPILHPNDPPEVLEFLEAGMTPSQVVRERALLADQERAA
jgi:hypothetical protein